LTQKFAGFANGICHIRKISACTQFILDITERVKPVNIVGTPIVVQFMLEAGQSSEQLSFGLGKVSLISSNPIIRPRHKRVMTIDFIDKYTTVGLLYEYFDCHAGIIISHLVILLV
jgi:hypothetical protein